ncbi:DUF6257 family protein [Streptomyces sp. NPDC059008]|uniref:DUF6257 family protein n=1 Tax=Streptomyces sp. NPDC059008 TaxID=3346693 RepID=UPI0036A84564
MARHDEPKLTPAEKTKVAWYVTRMAKRGLAGDHVYQRDLEAAVEGVLEGARKREKRGTAAK